MAATPIPIVVCGRHPPIAKAAAKAVLPDYNVIKTCFTVEEAKSSIPPLLSDTSSSRPHAIVFGGAFTELMFTEIHDACVAAEGERKVLWLRTDTSRQQEMPDVSDPEAYGTAMGQRLKSKLDELKVGKEDGVKEGVHFI